MSFAVVHLSRSSSGKRPSTCSSTGVEKQREAGGSDSATGAPQSRKKTGDGTGPRPSVTG